MSEIIPRVVVSVMVIKDGKLLLNFRKGSFAANMFGVAGGKLDVMESFQQCAERECMEEAGVRIGPVRFVCVMNTLVHNPHHFVIVGVITNWMGGEPQVMEPEKCESWGWYDFDALPQPLTEVTKCLIESYKSGNNYVDTL